MNASMDSQQKQIKATVIGAFVEKIDSLQVAYHNMQQKMCEIESVRSVQSAQIKTLSHMLDVANEEVRRKDKMLALTKNEMTGRDNRIAELEVLMEMNNRQHRDETKNMQQIIDKLLLQLDNSPIVAHKFRPK